MNENELEFKGVKRRTKEELQNMMYTEKMAEWLEEAKKEEAQGILNGTIKSQPTILNTQLSVI